MQDATMVMQPEMVCCGVVVVLLLLWLWSVAGLRRAGQAASISRLVQPCHACARRTPAGQPRRPSQGSRIFDVSDAHAAAYAPCRARTYHPGVLGRALAAAAPCLPACALLRAATGTAEGGSLRSARFLLFFPHRDAVSPAKKRTQTKRESQPSLSNDL